MKFKNLEDLINYIMSDIMKEDWERQLRMSFGEKSILMFVFESEIPIEITVQKIYDATSVNGVERIFAEVCAELLQTNIGRGWLKMLDEICDVIDENAHIFEKLLKKGE